MARCSALQDAGSIPAASIDFIKDKMAPAYNGARYQTLKWYLAPFSLFLFLAGCATVPPTRPGIPVSLGAYRITIGSTAYLPSSAIVKGLDATTHWDPESSIWILTVGPHELRATPQMPTVLVDGEAVALSAAPVVRNGELLLPEQLWKERLSRWIAPPPIHAPVPPGRLGLIVLDPGHGGNDPGAIGRGGLREKEVTLDIARRLKDLLAYDGFRVVMTRSDDRFIPLGRRSQIANQEKADLYVSIHANASRNRSASGFEVYYLSEATDDHARALEAAENTSLPSEVGGTLHSGTDAIVWDLLYTEHRAESTELAQQVCWGLKQSGLRSQNRGIKSARFAVLKGSRMPAVLVEVGFITHPKEETWLRTTSYRQTVAEGIRKGILAFKNNFNGRYASSR